MAKRLQLSKVFTTTLLCFLSVSSTAELVAQAMPMSASGDGLTHEPNSRIPSRALASDGSLAEDEKDLSEARDLYAKGDYEAALKRLDEFKSKNPESRFKGQAENLSGLCYLLLKKPLQAIPYFKSALSDAMAKGEPTTPYLLYNLAKAQTEASLLEDSERSLSQIDSASLDQETRSKYQFLKAALLLRRERPLEAAKEILAAGRNLEESQIKEYRGPFLSLLEQALKRVKETSQITSLYQENNPSPFADFLLSYLSSRESPQEPESPVEPSTIGILLPLKGKFAKFGERALQGIELAFNIFDSTKPDPKVTLVIEDSGDEPDQAIQALNRLVTQHHAAAIIGPLLTKGIESITKRAQELRVPLLSLAKQPGANGDYVISAGMTYQMQAFEIARHAIQKMHLQRFAILSPKDKVGEDFIQHFWDAVESLGGEITGVESYNPGETDFRQPIDKLSGLYYTEARQKELDDLAKLREENKIRKRTRKTEQYYLLKPIVDYDAVFIPDEPKVAGQILPTFAYRDVENIQFLGPSAWNSSELTSRAQASAEKAILVDAYFPDSESPMVKRFIERYRSTFSQEPTAIDALAFDAGAILSTAIAETSVNRTRGDILKHLKAVSKHAGVTGDISFRDGQFYRTLNILTIQQGKIIEAGKIQATHSAH